MVVEVAVAFITSDLELFREAHIMNMINSGKQKILKIQLKIEVILALEFKGKYSVGIETQVKLSS